MKRAEIAAAFAFLLFGAYVVFEAAKLPYDVDRVPGPGFAPLWIGIFIAMLAASLLWTTLLQEAGDAQPLLPDGAGLRRLAGILAALILAIALMEMAGFTLAVFGFLLVTLTLMEKRRALPVIALAAVSTGLIYLVFGIWLKVPFPKGTLFS